jgi:conjugal transfer pilus assembly protein TraW
LEFIQARLKILAGQGAVESSYGQWWRQVESHVNRPIPLHLPHARTKRTFVYRPEIVLDMDITDDSGRILVAQGTRVNALEQRPNYSPCWLFFNADELSELRWAARAMHQCSNAKIILTGGAIADVETALKTPIYFDQAGVITQKLNVRATPARVTRKANALKIEELVIKENGDAL